MESNEEKEAGQPAVGRMTAMQTFPRRIALLGSTGSIGRQTLDVVRCFPEHFEVVALAAHSNLSLLAQQAEEFAPTLVACFAETAAIREEAHRLLVEARCRERRPAPRLAFGLAGLLEAATLPQVDLVVVATSGLVALEPVMAAIQAGKTIALANKETLVMAGHLVMEAARRAGVAILPIDSEHSALWQCLRGEDGTEVRRLILTASGGPFRRTPLTELPSVTVAQALAHPTWRMGPKVTVDSATLMNKGLEVIEAHWLFAVPYERIEVVIQPESIIHSMVEFVDGSIKMQASLPSMHLPILDALSYPLRLEAQARGLIRPLDWAQVAQLHFETLDVARFPCYRLAREAAERGGTYPCALVGADEEAVALFLAGQIGLLDIARLIEAVLERHATMAQAQPDIPVILQTRDWARQTARELAASLGVVRQATG
ncbi:1-deoxy-D-xylulose-5-phosphate reductoisomerase [Thermogemmatispora sp.]|uniref:1-deoxy-D-xylulose-5-phosphate reductoisomerase n=1 Tax=Thermogemmatispora sp. TaxID=1968838 RepID=UPI00263814B6|nr:1-deoxy-D-xylulose-5-phosphate reductoisomerase [Thermogemmatispora sp.]